MCRNRRSRAVRLCGIVFCAIALFAVSLATLALAATGKFVGDGGIELDAPYVPTPQPVVDTMLRIASVSANDIVYDLGSGDGRLVI